MPQLLIMRHAKSDWASPVDGDHGRPLAPRGVKAARFMGRFLSSSAMAPDLVLTSTAVRAASTVQLAAEAGDWGCKIVEIGAFYASSPEIVINQLATTHDLPSRVLIAGHEPTWSGLVAVLVGGGRVKMPTAAVACVELGDLPWCDLTAGCGELRWLVTPKSLKGLI